MANFITEIEFTCAVSTVSFKATYAAANIRPVSICTQGVGITSVPKGAVALIEIYKTVTEMVCHTFELLAVIVSTLQYFKSQEWPKSILSSQYQYIIKRKGYEI